MICADCKWFREAAMEGNDRCKHEKSGHQVGGIREESRIVFYTCGNMLTGLCKNHCLFEPKLEVA